MYICGFYTVCSFSIFFTSVLSCALPPARQCVCVREENRENNGCDGYEVQCALFPLQGESPECVSESRPGWA